MQINNQDDIVQLITTIERDCPINSWKFNTIHLWPFIRTNLYFFLLHKVKYKNLDNTDAQNTNPKTPKNTSKTNSVRDLITRPLLRISQPYKFRKWLNALEKREVLFFGHTTYRAEMEGKKVNKFFDPLIEEWNLNDFYWIEEDAKLDISTLSHPENILDIRLPLSYFITTNTYQSQQDYSLSLEKYGCLEDKIVEADAQEFLDQYSAQKIGAYFHTNIYRKVSFYKTVLGKIKPQKIYVLCYYCNSTQPLIIAANLLNIEVIEMQHGVQSVSHLGYGSWTNLPQEHYHSFPKTIWNWDQESSKLIQQSMQHKVESFVGGNPWLMYFEKKSEQYTLPENMILYTLQPFFSMEEMFPQILINYIKEHNYIWYIRLHPRQKNDIELIKQFLQEAGVTSKINIDDAFVLPLPVLIKKALINVTHFSSTVIEAFLLGKKTIILDKTGIDYYANYLEEKKAFYIPFDKNFSEKTDQLLTEIQPTISV